MEHIEGSPEPQPPYYSCHFISHELSKYCYYIINSNQIVIFVIFIIYNNTQQLQVFFMIGSMTKSVFTKTQTFYVGLLNKNVYNTAFAVQKTRKKSQMKPYQILLNSLPVTQININSLIASTQLQISGAAKLLAKSSKTPELVTNSTQIAIQTLYFLIQSKYLQKGFVLLTQNLFKIMDNPYSLSKSGVFKRNLMRKLIVILKKVDSLFGETCIHLISKFIINAIQQSNINKKTFDIQKVQTQAGLADLRPLFLDQNLSQAQRTEVSHEFQTLKQTLVQLEWEYPFFEQEDQIRGLTFLLEKGYFNDQVVQLTEKYIKTDYKFQSTIPIMQKREEKRKSAQICCWYNLINSKIQLLNSYKSYKKQIKSGVKSQKNKQKKQEIATDKMIQLAKQNQQESDLQKSICDINEYQNLIKQYVQILQNSQYLCYLLDDPTLGLVGSLLTDFYNYIQIKGDQKSKQKSFLQQVKEVYIKVLKRIFCLQKNGSIYAESNQIFGVFQIILKMFDYQERKDIFQILQIFQRFALFSNFEELDSQAVFYVCQKYKYRSNFLASKYLSIVNKKHNLQKDNIFLKEQMIFQSVQMCKNLSLYFKILQPYENQTLSSQNQKYNKEINQAIQIFLNNYNKIISVLYFQDQKFGFIDKCVQMIEQIRNKKKFYKNSLEDVTMKEDIKRILRVYQKGFLKKNDKNIKNYYFDTKEMMNSSIKSYEQQSKRKLNENQGQGSYQVQKKKKWNQSSKQTQREFDFKNQTFFVRHQTNLQFLAQISTILDVSLTAIKLQKFRGMLTMDDTHVVLKGIFINQRIRKIVTENITYPMLLCNLLEIGKSFKSQSNQNILWKQIYKSTKFDVNYFVRDQRVKFAKQGKLAFFIQQEIRLNTLFQEHLHTLQKTSVFLKNARLQKIRTYQNLPMNIMSNIRSDVIYIANKMYGDLKKIANDQLMDLAKKFAHQKSKAIKFQTSYLQYPYLADLAISKSNSITILLIRDKHYMIKNERCADRAVEQYLDKCEKYFKQSKMNVVIVTNIAQLKEAIRNLVN